VTTDVAYPIGFTLPHSPLSLSFDSREDIGEEDIKEVSMPSGIPFVYKVRGSCSIAYPHPSSIRESNTTPFTLIKFDSEMKPLPAAAGKISQAHTSGIFLEKPGLLKEALRRDEEYKGVVPGSYGQASMHVQRVSTLEKSLLKLKEEQAGGRDHRIAVNPNDDGKLIVTTVVEGGGGDPSAPIEDGIIDSEFEEFYDSAPEAEEVITFNIQRADEVSPGIIKQGKSKDPVVVFIRHGRTPHNNLGLFTGWEDPPLAPDGVEDAKNAGRLLKMHGFEFDVVYTSWLTRAIETACECTKNFSNLLRHRDARQF
jgi:hypothetical protein